MTIKMTIFVILIGILLIPSVLADDTGTYKIQKYDVVLTPHYNGDITISIDQNWLVTGGHIPWVTVGLPNSNYEVQDYGGAAQTVRSDNGGGWDGVRVDLSRDFQPQESFDFNFTVVQHGLLEKSGDGYKLEYTPGWYDRAFTDDLTLKLVSPAKVEQLKTDPVPSTINGQDVIWERKGLGKGEKFTITVNFPNGTYNRTLMESGGGGDIGWLLLIVVGVGVLFIIGLGVASSGGSDYSREYRSSYGSIEERRRRRKKDDDDGYTSPIIYSGASKGSHSSHSSGGGGGFGGRSTSCACACVSCACACACAGGGGAGCKKIHHFCEKCLPKKVEGSG